MAHVLYDATDNICTITLNRPERRNAADDPMARELLSAFERFEADGDLKVAVLTGAGGTFCSGADLIAVNDPEIALCRSVNRFGSHSNLPLDIALNAEGRAGVPIVFAEGATGAQRFADGAGRHGQF